MEKMVYKAIIRYLKMHYPDELYKIVKRANEIIADLYARLKLLNGIMNINRPGFLKILRKYMYKSYQAYSDKVNALDHSYAKIMHAKLIRTHTVATGADSCDYWYVPDESDTAKSYNGRIV